MLQRIAELKAGLSIKSILFEMGKERADCFTPARMTACVHKYTGAYMFCFQRDSSIRENPVFINYTGCHGRMRCVFRSEMAKSMRATLGAFMLHAQKPTHTITDNLITGGYSAESIYGVQAHHKYMRIVCGV